MVRAGSEDYRPVDSREFQIGVSRHSGGGRIGGARLALVLGLTALVVAGSWALPLGTAAANAAAARPAPKVVLIVGPAGAATPYYRGLADEAAVAASKLTTNVVKIYSPDATWPNVKAALQGASVVVYLGHGNGFPSIYHDALFPATEDGFGLNPHAGAADSHQYFGEAQIGAEIKLARDAVVIFSHLCYASGNAEPGLPEGTLDQAQQRVDNYAAGFFQAGAGAVIADAYLAPEYYVRSVLRGNRSIDAIWKDAPNRNDHFLRFASQRTKGAIAQMDPDNVDSGFHRSIVLNANLTSGEVVGHAVAGPGTTLPVPDPTLTGLGVTFGAPDLTTPPTAGSKTTLTLPVASDAAALLPAKLMVGTRWDRLDGGAASPPPPATPAPTATPSPSASAAPATGGSTGAPAVAPTGDADPGTTAADDPVVDLVVAEQPGEVVAPVRARRLRSGGIAVPVTIPSTPGLYRLVATVHQPDGVAYDAATQALIPALVVRVTGPLNATYAVPATATAAVGASFDLTVRVTNLGRTAWGHPADARTIVAAERQPASRAMLVARWVDLGGLGVTPAGMPGGVANSVLPAGLAAGASVTVDVPLLAPASPGEYLLVLDVVDPATGSLAAAGVPPGIIRVTVSR
ncbi:MAG: hypothetical protein QOE42_427 [Chloroflexota bacterium]|nr:hypothetical protein [Chloroflexota bacterium]